MTSEKLVGGRYIADPSGLLPTEFRRVWRNLLHRPSDGTLPINPTNEKWRARIEASIFGKKLDRLVAKMEKKPGENISPLSLLLNNGYKVVGIFHESIVDTKLVELQIGSSDYVSFRIWPNNLLVVDQAHPKGITKQTGYELVLTVPAAQPKIKP